MEMCGKDLVLILFLMKPCFAFCCLQYKEYVTPVRVKCLNSTHIMIFSHLNPNEGSHWQTEQTVIRQLLLELPDQGLP